MITTLTLYAIKTANWEGYNQLQIVPTELEAIKIKEEMEKEYDQGYFEIKHIELEIDIDAEPDHYAINRNYSKQIYIKNVKLLKGFNISL